MKSKKLHFIFLVFVFSLSTACTTTDPIQPIVVNPPSPEEVASSLRTLYETPESTLELGVILSSEMANGCFDYITQLFDETMHQKYSIETLYTDWQIAVEDFGNFIAISDAKEEAESSLSFVSVILQYEYHYLLLCFTFEGTDSITDFSFNLYDSETFSIN